MVTWARVVTMEVMRSASNDYNIFYPKYYNEKSSGGRIGKEIKRSVFV